MYEIAFSGKVNDFEKSYFIIHHFLALNGTFYFSNVTQPLLTEGSETYFRISDDDIEIYAGYTYDYTQRKYYPNQPTNPLTPKNDFATDIAYNIEGGWRFAGEASYTDMQHLEDYSKVPGYWIFALMLEKKFKKVNIILNGENLSNVKETNYGSIVIPPYNNPGFKSVWEPLTGRIFNLAVQIKI